MEKIRSLSQLYVWTRDLEDQIDSEANEVMYFLQSVISDEDWALCALHMLGADRLLYARKTSGGVRLKSGVAFRKRYRADLTFTISMKLLRKFTNSCRLQFEWIS